MGNESPSLVPVIYLFTEGLTERDYVEQLAKTRNVRIVPVKVDSSPMVLLTSAVLFARENAQDLRVNGNAEIWVVFDYDEKQREIAESADALWKCHPACLKSCAVKDFNRCECRDVIKRIRVAYMAPCIELWGLICTEKGASLKKLPLDRRELQRKLHEFMPRYSHDAGARFDLGKMTHTQQAIARARSWAATSGDFPKCINASYYAGIAPLVTKILACPPKQHGLNDASSWRRR